MHYFPLFYFIIITYIISISWFFICINYFFIYIISTSYFFTCIISSSYFLFVLLILVTFLLVIVTFLFALLELVTFLFALSFYFIMVRILFIDLIICLHINNNIVSTSLYFLFLILLCKLLILLDKYSSISNMHTHLSIIGVYFLIFIDIFASKTICSLTNCLLKVFLL